MCLKLPYYNVCAYKTYKSKYLFVIFELYSIYPLCFYLKCKIGII